MAKLTDYPRFQKYQKIKHEGKLWQCIVCDEEIAAFGLLVKKEDHWSTSYEKTFFVSNNMDDGFEWEDAEMVEYA